jgi:hypothetical protein
MKRNYLLIIISAFLVGLFVPTAYSGEIQLQVKDFECVEDGKIAVHYSVNNTFGFDYNNVSLCFKLVEDDKPIACKEIKITIPKETDGSEVKELILNASCSNRSLSLKSAVFYMAKRYRIEEWFSDCK